MSNVLTIFFCGTSAYSEQSEDTNNTAYFQGELVATLFKNCRGLPYIDKLIFDGPGSGNKRENEKWIQSDKPNQTYGGVTGAGWENNVKAAVTVALAHVNIGTYTNRKGKEVNEQVLPYWIPDMQRQKCKDCGNNFGPFTRKHHCRRCGEIFCSACLPKDKDVKHVITDKYTLPNANAYIALKPGKVKVCKSCFEKKEGDFLEQLNQKNDTGPNQSYIQELRNNIAEYRNKQPLTTINLIGWSRGGVTCIMFANACAEIEELKYININIFTLDPVPGYGSGGFDDSRCTLKNNVWNYHSMIAENEVTAIFAPVIPKTADTTATVYNTIPGSHVTLVGSAAMHGGGAIIEGDPGYGCTGVGSNFKRWAELIGKDESGTDTLTLHEPAIITRDLAEKALEVWGTELDNKLSLNDTVKLQYYDSMIKKKVDFENVKRILGIPIRQGSWFNLGTVCRDVLVKDRKGKTGYVSLTDIKRLSGGFYVNKDHGKTVMTVFPQLANIITKCNNYTPDTKASFQRSLAKLADALGPISDQVGIKHICKDLYLKIKDAWLLKNPKVK